MDELIQNGKSNFKIKQDLENHGFSEELIPENKQLSNRRTYLKSLILGELANNTKGGFYTWLQEHSKDFTQANPHEMLALAHDLNDKDFRLLISTKSLLKNAVRESRDSLGYLAMDSTHKVVSCQFILTTITTATTNQEMADIAYFLHAHEDSESFTYALTKIKSAIMEIYNYEWKINVSIFK